MSQDYSGVWAKERDEQIKRNLNIKTTKPLADKVGLGARLIIMPTMDERKLDGYYFQDYGCNNCGSPWNGTLPRVVVMIPLGMKRPKTLTCPNCETKSLV